MSVKKECRILDYISCEHGAKNIDSNKYHIKRKKKLINHINQVINRLECREKSYFHHS